jgi:hypothetical protein
MPARTAIEWALANPVLNAGACAYESDTGRWKLGNGRDSYTLLKYQSESGPPGKEGPAGINGQAATPTFLTIGTVTSGATASATITGTPPNQVLNLVLPATSGSGGTSNGGTSGSGGPAVLRFVSQPDDESVTDGDAVVFTAEASQSQGAVVTYKWQYLPPNTTDQTKWVDVASPPISVLRLSADLTMNGRSYRCIAQSGSVSVASSSALLFVARQASGPVQIDAQPFDVTVREAGTAIFTVQATANTGFKPVLSRLAWKWEASAAASDGGWDPASWVTLDGSSGVTVGFSAKAVLSFAARKADTGRSYRCVLTAETGTGTTTNNVIMGVSFPTTTVSNWQPVSGGTLASQDAKLTVT